MRFEPKATVLGLLVVGIAALGVFPIEVFSAAQGSTITKDPAAMAALAQMITATGWNPLNLPNDGVLSGTVVKPFDQTGRAITLKMKGLRRCGQ